MKIISLLLCLFLLFSNTNAQIEVPDYITQSKEVSFEDASTLSAEIQDNYNRNLKIKNLGDKILSMCDEEQSQIESSLSNNKQEKEENEKQYEQILKKIEQSQEDLQILEKFESLKKEIQKEKKQLKNIKQSIQTIQSELSSIEKQLDIDDQAQDILDERFSSKYPEIKEGGEYDPNKSISGSQNLPSYGGTKTYRKSSSTSCLVAGDYAIDSYSEYWIYPIYGGIISAGTWYYPNGDLHLGMDYAVDLYTEVVAPANGLILYADNPVDSNCGYLGNWCGWPYGGGNTIAMICAVDGNIYGVTFAHLSNQIYVYAGQQVSQGQTIALSGNSGNSTGPHCHIEVFTLYTSLADIVDYFADTADFSFGCSWYEPATCSEYACRVRPETIL